MPFALQFMDGQKAGEILPLVNNSVTIGRSIGELLFEDTEVSSKHCSIQVIAGELILVDHASRNGTFLNGQRTDRSRLRAGDVVRIGQVNFRIIEWPMVAQFQDPLLMVKNWCNKVSQAESGQFSNPISTLVEKELELCLADVQLRLTIESKDGRIASHVVPVGEIVLGRAGAVPLVAEDEEASRKHARIYVADDGVLYVEDLGSANGTFFNEERLSGRKALLHGDIVRLGRTRIQAGLTVSEFNLPIQI
ncbi:MAG: FHA domain-containing protein [Silvanigrellaceae bacterium]